MRILIADDEPVSRRQICAALERNGHEVVAVADGEAALAMLAAADGPRLAILDWLMPKLDGLEVCRRIRAVAPTAAPYLILLTARIRKEDVVTGLTSGANDYIVKPFDGPELDARVRVGLRVLELQTSLAERVSELEEALARVRLLQGLLPICSYCKRIRDAQDDWAQLESYISEHSEARFSHAVCPDCYERHLEPEVAQHRLAHAHAAIAGCAEPRT